MSGRSCSRQTSSGTCQGWVEGLRTVEQIRPEFTGRSGRRNVVIRVRYLNIYVVDHIQSLSLSSWAEVRRVRSVEVYLVWERGHYSIAVWHQGQWLHTALKPEAAHFLCLLDSAGIAGH